MNIRTITFALLAAAAVPALCQDAAATGTQDLFNIYAIGPTFDTGGDLFAGLDSVNGVTQLGRLLRTGKVDPVPRKVPGNPDFSFSMTWDGSPDLSNAVADGGHANQVDIALAPSSTSLSGAPARQLQRSGAQFNEWVLDAENGVSVVETARFSYGFRQLVVP